MGKFLDPPKQRSPYKVSLRTGINMDEREFSFLEVYRLNTLTDVHV